VQVALFDHVAIGAEFMVDVPADKVHRGQLELLTARIAVFLIEVLAGALHTLDVLAHRVDTLRHLFDSGALHLACFAVHFAFKVRLDHSLLVLQFLDQEGRDDRELNVCLRLQNLQHQQRRQDVLLPDVVERSLDVVITRLGVAWHISEERKRLDP